MSTFWPESYEALRAEAHAMGITVHEASAQVLNAPEPDAWIAQGRALHVAQDHEAPGGRDESIAGVPCRVFDPLGDARRGTYLHLHGGALMWGSPRLNDNENAELATTCGVRVVSVDYRLAPEHPHPAGADDCLAVAEWVIGAESGPIVIGGESAGGYLSAVTLLRVRDELDAIDRVAGTNLVFGIFDLTGTPTTRGARPSTVPPLLEGMRPIVLNAYVPGLTMEEARDGSISPLYADLHDMPRALFTVGHADSLLDDSLFMAARWQAYGNDAELRVYPDCSHGFTNFPIELGRLARRRIFDFLGEIYR